ncbi:hypothetical protein Tco_0488475 [Tanacetum coccineum]
MELYMQNRKHGRMILESVEDGPLIWPMIKENGMTKTKKYEELSATNKIQADCDLKATNIILQGLPSNVYSLVNHHRVAKDLWERVQLLMQGTLLTKQERECNLYDVNTKFLNSLSPEWSKFVTDVKLVRDLHTTNFDQLNAYLEQHELHANEVRIMREHNQDPLALVAYHQMTPSHFNTYQSSYNNPQFQQQFSPSRSPQYGSIHPTQHYSTTYSSTPCATTYPSTPYPNAYSSTVHQDACPQPQSIPQIEYIVSTINQQTHLAEFPQIDSGLAVLVFKQGDDHIDAINKMMTFMSTVERQSSFATGTSRTRANISGTGGNNSGQQRVMKCFNCQGEVLNEEELEFLADPGVAEGPVTQTVIIHNVTYQADDLDAYDFDCEDFSTAKAVLMANLSSYGSDVLFEEPHSKNTHNDMLNQSVHDTSSSAQQDAMILSMFEQLSNQVTNCNNVNKDNLIANESLSVELERYKERVKLLEERQNVDDYRSGKLRNIDKEIALEKKVKELDNIFCKMGQSAQTVHMLTKPQVFYDNNLKQALGFQNPFYLKKAQRIRPMLYDGSVIAEEQSDPMVLERNVNIKTINYAELNRLSEDFGKCFVDPTP